MAQAPAPKRGEIWLVDFDPAVGAEIRKARPAVVISVKDIGRLPLRIVVPITDWKLAFRKLPVVCEDPGIREQWAFQGLRCRYIPSEVGFERPLCEATR